MIGETPWQVPAWLRPRDLRGIGRRHEESPAGAPTLTRAFVVVGTGVDPVTSRFSAVHRGCAL
jgi:hypothetical protein